MSQHKKNTQNPTPCVAQAAEQWQNQEPSAEELALVTKSFARCLLDRGYQSKDLLEAANLLLDHALEESKQARKPKKTKKPAKSAKKAKKPKQAKASGGRAGSTKMAASAP